MAGLVFAGSQKAGKAGQLFDPEIDIRVTGTDCPYVSRGGLKLAHALDVFQPPVAGACGLDLGISTGGFTDCLLQRGAARIFGVDVGRGQLHWKLRQDPRVVLRERCNARFLQPDDFPPVFFRIVVADLSFISLKLILSPLHGILAVRGEAQTHAILLVKPQFEAQKREVGKGGIVKDAAVQERILQEVAAESVNCGFFVAGSIPSPVPGMDGNREFLLYLHHHR